MGVTCDFTEINYEHMTRIIIVKYFVPVLILFMAFSCDDNSDHLHKEKEMRLLRQYLEAKNITAEPESNGLYFIPIDEGSGIKPEKDHWVIIRYTAKTINDNIFDTTDEKVAISNNIYSASIFYGDKRLPLASTAIAGVREGLMMMREGGHATLIIPSHLGYGSAVMGRLPPYSTLIYDIELVKVIPDPAVYEKQIIENYVAMYADSAHLVLNERESGLYYIEISEGTGDNLPEEDENVSVYYKGTLMEDARVFDSNIGGSAFTFTIGANQTIKGFEEGVKLMKKEGRSRLVIPSSIGYGEGGSGDKIPGYTPLVFDIKLADIR